MQVVLLFIFPWGFSSSVITVFWELYWLYGGPWYPRSVSIQCMDEARQKEILQPWDHEASFTELLPLDGCHNAASRFHRPDIWNTIHLGVGKAFISSSMAILQQAIPASNIDDRFKQITADYKEFCRDHHLVRFVTKLDKRTFNVGGPLEEPVGGWNKASVTSTLAEFLEYMTIRYADGLEALNDERVAYIVTCLYSIF